MKVEVAYIRQVEAAHVMKVEATYYVKKEVKPCDFYLLSHIYNGIQWSDFGVVISSISHVVKDNANITIHKNSPVTVLYMM